MGPEPLNPEILVFAWFLRVLEAGRHPRGSPDAVGSILYKYRPKRSHGDLIRVNFDDFVYFCHILKPSLLVLEAKNGLQRLHKSFNNLMRLIT